METEFKSFDEPDFATFNGDKYRVSKPFPISLQNDADKAIENDASVSDVLTKIKSKNGDMFSASNGVSVCRSLDRSFESIFGPIFHEPTFLPNRQINRQRSHSEQKFSTIVSQDWLHEFSITSLPNSTPRSSVVDDGVTIEDLAQNPFENYFPRPDPPRFDAVVRRETREGSVLPSAEELEFAALIVAEAGIDNGDYDDLTNDAAQLNGDCDFDRDGQPIAKKSRLATASKSRPAPTAAFFDEDLTNFYEQPTDIFCEPSTSSIFASTARRKKMKSFNLVKKLHSESPSLSFETPPTTPSDGEGQWQPSILIEAFRNGGSGVGPGPELRLELGHNPGPPTLFSCRSCRNFDPSERLNNLSKHIETKHCPDLLLCLLCKSDDRGHCPYFETSNTALLHAMEYHNSNEHRYFLCDICQVLVYGVDIIVGHMRRHHAVDPLDDRVNKMRRFPCLLCLFPFKHSGHRVDHFRANHRIDIKTFYTRNLKKGPASRCGNGTGSLQSRNVTPMSSQKKLVSVSKLKSEDLYSYGTKKLKNGHVGSDARAHEDQPKLIRIVKKDRVVDDDEVSISSSTTSRNNSNRRMGLRPDLKDKYADILMNQPQVVLPDIFEDYLQGRYDYYAWNFFERTVEKPKIRLDRKDRNHLKK